MLEHIRERTEVKIKCTSLYRRDKAQTRLSKDKTIFFKKRLVQTKIFTRTITLKLHKALKSPEIYEIGD